MSLQHLLSPDDSARPPPRPYAPTRRVTPAQSVLVPISRVELVQCQTSVNPLRSRPPPPSLPLPPSTLPPRPASLPPKPSAEPRLEGVNGRKRPYEERDTGVFKRQRGNEDTRVVANHCASRPPLSSPALSFSAAELTASHADNARPNIDRETRRESPIIGLKSFNNWIKSVLIAKHGRREGDTGPKVKVLDLGCGKGGDLQKWMKAGTDEYVGVDLAAVSVEQARQRWETMRGARFAAHFYTLDCFEDPIEDVLPPQDVARPFDIVSMQFCMHYAFESEHKARRMLENVSKYLKPGGVFLGTIPDASNLLDKLASVPEESEVLAFGNSVYGVKFDQRERMQGGTTPFGHRYTFFLQDAVEEVPEYVVYWDEFVECVVPCLPSSASRTAHPRLPPSRGARARPRLAAEYGLEPSFVAPFEQIFAEESDDPQFAQLLTRMRVVDEEGNAEMNEDQLEAAMLYLGFAFVKR
ncbi:SPOSA6832_01416 [Sporobolomyces salmonicolor]|uniref:mRNA cap guanine-N(7) methyltransferase n=1 Tax=Sporidiobolus salmonicolor TaxID=5005 RepID=A0A0D6EIW3_SPOSA|nr:SPOSA6832_01416 [Sporobolomyces salmonicolor]